MIAFLNPKRVHLNPSHTQNHDFLCVFYVSCTRFAHFLCISYPSFIKKCLFLCALSSSLLFSTLRNLWY